MISPKLFDDMARRVSDSLPEGMKELRQDVEHHVRLNMQSMFEKMDLVTREEFDVQAAVLQRTRAKLEALEARVAELEARLAQQ